MNTILHLPNDRWLKDGYIYDKNKPGTMMKNEYICEVCLSEDGNICDDPYQHDTYDEVVEMVLCSDCYNDKLQSI